MNGERLESRQVMIRPASAVDAAAAAEIYNHHVNGTVVTFEEEPVAVAEMMRRIAEVSARYPWLIAEVAGAVAGYAYASAWKPRSAYRFTVETSIYIAAAWTGRGVGTLLYPALLARLESAGFRSAIGGIALPNPASVALHERLGFVPIGRLRSVGWKLGRWVDVGYWQRDLAAGAGPA